jgi:hypothetical protein
MPSTRGVAWLEPRLQAEISSAERLLAVDAVLRQNSVRSQVVDLSAAPPPGQLDHAARKKLTMEAQ